MKFTKLYFSLCMAPLCSLAAGCLNDGPRTLVENETFARDLPIPTQRLPAANCSQEKEAEVLALASTQSPDAIIDCTLQLKDSRQRITKRLTFLGGKSSGTTLDCAGSRIEPSTAGYSIAIISQKNDRGEWIQPSDIVVKNCSIKGSIRVWGMATNGEGQLLRESSQQAAHTARAQAAAPTKITFDKIAIEANGTTPFYLSPGVTEVTLQRSSINGKGTSVAVYLDAESARNTIWYNNINMKSESREVLAVDGSANNLIANNYFSGLEHGGIYLYRNCGEKGTVRHQPPQNNRIINNYFYYDRYMGGNPSIFLASRNGNRRYCGDDKGYPFGSSANDLDFATGNIVAQNQIGKLSVSKMIIQNATPNYILANESVGQKIDREPGCFVNFVLPATFIKSGMIISKPGNTETYRCQNAALTKIP